MNNIIVANHGLLNALNCGNKLILSCTLQLALSNDSLVVCSYCW